MIPLALLSTALAADPASVFSGPSVSFGIKGLTVADAAGANTFNLGLSFQPRVTATFSGDREAADQDVVSDEGIRIRRMLLTANGTLAGRLEYRFRINAANALSFPDADGKTQLASKPVLDDAQVVFRIAEPLQVSIGQWKAPFTVSQAMSDTALLFPDRPIPIDGYKFSDVKLDGLGWSRDAGAALLGTVAEKRFEYAVGVFNGDGQNVWPGESGLLYVGRVQAAPLGELKYDEVDLARGPARLGIGASASFNTHATYDNAGAVADADTILRAGGDLRFAVAGLSIQGEAIYSVTHTGGTENDGIGAYAQLGYCLPIGIAPGVRWSRLDPALDGKDDAVTQLEAVVNGYLPDPAKAGSNLGHKVQLQLGWATSLLEGSSTPLAHQVQLAAAVGF